MMNQKSVRMARRLCVAATLAIAVLDLPKWALIAALVPAAILLGHCVLTILGRRWDA